MSSHSSLEDSLSIDTLERGLIRGRAKWVADLTEFFRDYRMGDTIFSLYAIGRTRNSGFLISRFFAWTVLPNYSVSLFCVDEGNSILSVETVRNRINQVTRISQDKELQWAWLILFSDRNIPPSIVSHVSRYDKRELGIGVASTVSKQVVLSNNQIGKSIEKHLGLGKALGAERNWKI
jgi:hypothetical protein